MFENKYYPGITNVVMPVSEGQLEMTSETEFDVVVQPHTRGVSCVRIVLYLVGSHSSANARCVVPFDPPVEFGVECINVDKHYSDDIAVDGCSVVFHCDVWMQTHDHVNHH